MVLPWLGGASLAQVSNGYDVSVNPLPLGPQTLLYPGGEYLRQVGPLKQPGETDKPIHLHMPAARRHLAKAAPPPKPKPIASAPPPAATPDYAPPPPSSAASLFDNLPSAPPPAAASPAAPSLPGLTKRSMILFAHDAPDPSRDSLSAIKFLAGDLNSALTGSARIQLQAFGGPKGDKGSDARRLSLKRALAIRQVLIDDGVSPDRIDVRAMGGADDSGPADRVDVYLKS